MASCFRVITDNASNMRHAFELVMMEDSNDFEECDSQDDDNDEGQNDELDYWKPVPLEIEGWTCCS